MELNVVWHAPLALRRSDERIYDVDLESIPAEPGVYVFMRVFGKKHNPLYVGKAENLRGRIKTQLDALTPESAYS
jgi:excinuclease UvrABC nuclease subunit